MDNKDQAIEKTELIISALNYAHEHNLDISNKEDVKKIIKAVDPEHLEEIDIEKFMELLKYSDTFLELTANDNDEDKTNLPN